jgi:hypothetical protein
VRRKTAREKHSKCERENDRGSERERERQEKSVSRGDRVGKKDMDE